MEKLKFTLLAVVTLSIVGIVGYWSVMTIQSGSEHAETEMIEQLQKENGDLKLEVQKQKMELNTLKAALEEPKPTVTKTPEAPAPTVSKYQTLINELQKIVDSKTVLKEKSKGDRVGTVQKFLNIYNNTSTKVDNDYGPGTVARVKDFQKDVGLTADGEAGTSTFNKMIEWLEKQV